MKYSGTSIYAHINSKVTSPIGSPLPGLLSIKVTFVQSRMVLMLIVSWTSLVFININVSCMSYAGHIKRNTSGHCGTQSAMITIEGIF